MAGTLGSESIYDLGTEAIEVSDRPLSNASWCACVAIAAIANASALACYSHIVIRPLAQQAVPISEVIRLLNNRYFCASALTLTHFAPSRGGWKTLSNDYWSDLL